MVFSLCQFRELRSSLLAPMLAGLVPAAQATRAHA